MHHPSLLRLLALPLPLLLAAGCITLPKSDGELDGADAETGEPEPPGTPPTTGGASDGGDGDESGSDGGDGPGETGVVPTIRAVDILLVVDNSGSMGEEQAKLVGGIDSLLDVLDAAVPPVDYRIAVTTTDNGNPWCDGPAGTGSESGALRATSCASRILEFVFNGAETIDVSEEACLSVCDQMDLGLSEPWIEVDNTTGLNNVPGGDARAALACMLPQGINGCGFEQPLESMALALQRMQTPGDPAEGFRRPGALLAVGLITDEVDCSNNLAHAGVFLDSGERVFWSDPSAPAPTSAVCWNAGVQCIGTSPYDDCFAADLDEHGDPVTGDAELDAVMIPVQGYIDRLDDAGALVVAINGVTSDGLPHYADTLEDPDFQDAFGIGPGCTSLSGRATPPVRVREVVDAVSGPGHQHSICDDDFGPALASLAQGILQRLP